MGKYGLLLAVVFTLVLAACSAQIVCPAIGWSNTLLVELRGNHSRVAEVQACVDGVCSSPAARPVEGPTSSAGSRTPDAEGGTGGEQGSSPGAAPDATGQTIGPFLSTRIESDRWRIDLGMTAPENVTVRALDTAGEVLTEEAFALEWRRVGGSEECGGPGEAGPVVLAVP